VDELAFTPTEIHGHVLARVQRWLALAAQAAVDGLEQDLDALRFDALLRARFGNPADAPEEDVDGPDDGLAGIALPEYGQSLWFTDPHADGGQGMSTHGLPQDEQFDALFGFPAASLEEGE